MENCIKQHNISRRSAIMLGAGAVAVMGVGALLAGNGSGHSEEELVTEIYTGEDEECEEEPELTLGERIAHSACGVCMSAVGQTDYDDSETDGDASSVSANESTRYFEPVPELVN